MDRHSYRVSAESDKDQQFRVNPETCHVVSSLYRIREAPVSDPH